MIEHYGTPSSVDIKSMIALDRKYPYGRIVNTLKHIFERILDFKFI